jgi:hypothetical protein
MIKFMLKLGYFLEILFKVAKTGAMALITQLLIFNLNSGLRIDDAQS